MRRARIQLLLLSLLLLPTVVLAAGNADPPNIILILADDLGWADTGCYGNTFNETPHIDRMAKEGLRFTSYYTAGPVCSPTRASIQSGQYQARFGLTVHIPGHWRPFERVVEPPNAMQMPLRIETFAEALQTAGYRTGYFGKWHLGGQGFGPAEQGWETAIETQGNTVPPDLVGGETGRRTAEFLTDKAIEFLETRDDRPFLLQVSHYAVHIPLSTTPELEAKYQSKPAMAGYPSRVDYAGLLEELDDSVGRILSSLRELDLDKSTLVIFTSDNGGLETQQDGTVVTSNKPLRDEKGSLYEGGIRVPLIARWPGRIAPGGVCDRMAISTDFFPTFAELAQATDARRSLDGASLVRLLDNPKASLTRETLHWHFPHYHHSRPSGAIRVRNWKLIEFLDTGELELYNLRDDLGETHNLAQEQPALAADLQHGLATWRRKVEAQMPQDNPAYDPARAGEWWSRKTITPTGPAGSEGGTETRRRRAGASE